MITSYMLTLSWIVGVVLSVKMISFDYNSSCLLMMILASYVATLSLPFLLNCSFSQSFNDNSGQFIHTFLSLFNSIYSLSPFVND